MEEELERELSSLPTRVQTSAERALLGAADKTQLGVGERAQGNVGERAQGSAERGPAKSTLEQPNWSDEEDGASGAAAKPLVPSARPPPAFHTEEEVFLFPSFAFFRGNLL